MCVARVCTSPRVLYAHGLESGANGYKTQVMRDQGLDVTAPELEMSLWDVRQKNALLRNLLSPAALFSGYPSQWFSSAMDASFSACVGVMQTAASKGSFDVLVGSSWGGAVAAGLIATGGWKGPALLLCPALHLKEKYGMSTNDELSAAAITAALAALPAEQKQRIVLVHGTADATVSIDDSRALSAATGIHLEVLKGQRHGLSGFTRDGDLVEFVHRVAASRDEEPEEAAATGAAPVLEEKRQPGEAELLVEFVHHIPSRDDTLNEEPEEAAATGAAPVLEEKRQPGEAELFYQGYEASWHHYSFL